jgi:hypothetical protein
MQVFRDRLSRVLRDNWLLLLVMGGIAVAFFALRTPASAIGSMAELDAVLQNGQPTLVEFYSNT